MEIPFTAFFLFMVLNDAVLLATFFFVALKINKLSIIMTFAMIVAIAFFVLFKVILWAMGVVV